MMDPYRVYIKAKWEFYMAEDTKARKNATMQNYTP